MVIDDDSGVSNLLSIILNDNGYAVITAPNGKSALNTLKNCPLPSLILTDYCMPLLNGKEFTECIYAHSKFKDVPVVIITGSLIEELTLPTTPNFKGVIQKPFQVGTILDVVGELIEGNSFTSSVRLA